MELMNKKLFTETLDQLISIEKQCEISSEATEQYKKAVEGMPLLIPVVGEFSAGKSSLLNKFIGKSILSVGMTPETAIPTELHFSETEYVEGVLPDGCIEKISNLSDIASKYVCVKHYVNSEFLRQIQPIVLVDMPGFDSPLDSHNKAIFNYLDKGCQYIVLTPVDAGTVSKSMKNQIQNIYDFGKDCTFFLSKTDIRSDDEIDQVTEELSSELENIIGYRPSIGKINQNDISLFNTFIESINPDDLFKKQFLEIIKDDCYNVKTSVNTKLATLKNDKTKNIKTIEELKVNYEKIKNKKEKMIENAKNNSYADESESIANAVGVALNSEIDSLVNIALSSGQDALQEEIGRIIQNTVVSRINTVMTVVTSKFSQELFSEIKNLSEVLSDYNASNLLDKLKESGMNLYESAKVSINAYLNEREKNKDGKGSGYTLITGVLAAVTDVFAPVVEVLIIALPEILNFVYSKIQEKNRKEQLRESILGQIPSIKRKVRESVVEVLKNNTDDIILKISEQFEEELNKKSEEIQSAMNEIENNSNIEEKIQLYSSSISKTDALLNNLL